MVKRGYFASLSLSLCPSLLDGLATASNKAVTSDKVVNFYQDNVKLSPMFNTPRGAK